MRSRFEEPSSNRRCVQWTGEKQDEPEQADGKLLQNLDLGSDRRIKIQGINSGESKEKMTQNVCFCDCKMEIEIMSVIDSPTSIPPKRSPS